MRDEHELLLRHFQAWAGKKRRTPDLELLDELLHLRSAYDELTATYWPSGSVEHLLLERWPAKGPTWTPDEAVVVETIDSYVRFLRSTGRMSGRSADPAALGKEARRAATRMAATTEERANWSFTKQLMQFGRDQGIDLDDAPSVEELQARLDDTVALWNALPEAERRALSPGLEPPDDDSLKGSERALMRFDVDDPVVALLLSFGDRLPTGELSGEEVVAPFFAESGFGSRLLELTRWVGEGRELTAIGVLRPSLAREAYDALGLGDWQRSQIERRYPDERLRGVAAVGRDAWIAKNFEQTWRSAADCEELHRLWLGALGSGLVEVEGKRAFAADASEPSTERWVEIGIQALVAVTEHLRHRPYTLVGLVFAMLESYVGGCSAVPKRAVLDFLVDWHWSPASQQEWDGWEEPAGGWRERLMQPTVEEAVGLFSDTGLYVEEADSIRLTPFGDVFVTAWLSYLER